MVERADPFAPDPSDPAKVLWGLEDSQRAGLPLTIGELTRVTTLSFSQHRLACQLQIPACHVLFDPCTDEIQVETRHNAGVISFL
jgi:hypothetical protein